MVGEQYCRKYVSIFVVREAVGQRLMAPRSSPSTFGGVRIKLLAALAAGLFFGFGVCDLFMRLTAAPVPPLRLTAATTTTTTTTTTGLANGQPAPPAAPAAAAAAAAAGRHVALEQLCAVIALQQPHDTPD